MSIKLMSEDEMQLQLLASGSAWLESARICDQRGNLALDCNIYRFKDLLRCRRLRWVTAKAVNSR